MSATDRQALARRFPDVARWLERATAPSDVRQLPGSPASPGPTLEIEGIRLESATRCAEEAQWQARLVPVHSPRATVYGVAQGSLIRTLLRRDALQSLRVVILAPASAATSLSVLEHGDWLHDERLELVRGDRLDELDPPFAATPAALRLAARSCARLADLVRLELATPHIRRRLRAQEETWRERIATGSERFRADADARELFGRFPGATLSVAAAGPSLSEHFSRLSSRTTPLIAVDAALKPLILAGIVPDVVVTVDAHEDGMRRVFDVPSTGLGSCALVYAPVVTQDVVAAWPGQRYGAYPTSGFYDELARELPRARLWSSGSVLHVAVDLARCMGAETIELLGADFAHVGGRTHAHNAAWDAQASNEGPRVESGEGQMLPTRPNLIGYLRDLERYIAAHPETRFVNASRSGALIRGALHGEELVG